MIQKKNPRNSILETMRPQLNSFFSNFNILYFENLSVLFRISVSMNLKETTQLPSKFFRLHITNILYAHVHTRVVEFTDSYELARS